eukprot:5078587-Alexandrium_andersonii.AAC.1
MRPRSQRALRAKRPSPGGLESTGTGEPCSCNSGRRRRHAAASEARGAVAAARDADAAHATREGNRVLLGRRARC